MIPTWSDHPDLVSFYTRNRNQPEDLYKSEKRFLPELAKRSDSVLDVGCAAGGFARIWRHYNPAVAYTGVDVSRALIERARQEQLDRVRFVQGDMSEGLSLPGRYAHTVQALGCLHWEPKYEASLRELWRLTDRFLFFDIRLASGLEGEIRGRQKLELSGPWDGSTTTPYIVVDWAGFVKLIRGLNPRMILCYGYMGHPARSVMHVERSVCFAAFVLEKRRQVEDGVPTSVCLDLPFAWPAGMPKEVIVLPPPCLDGLLRGSWKPVTPGREMLDGFSVSAC
ncbi:MAG: class I SAM-dependent methyltransferase [bacterium]